MKQVWPGKEHWNVEPRECLAFLHKPARRNWLTGSSRRSKYNVAAKRREALEVLLEDVATDGLKEDVYSTSAGFLQNELSPILPGVVNGFRAQAPDEGQLFLGARCAEY